MIRFGLMTSCLCLSFTAYCGIAQDMDDFFQASGIQTNLNAPGAYQGQTAGLYTGGQLYARNQVKMIYPANIQLPSYSAGCGGIDAFTGSFSFISGDELINSMESIASSAASYAFMLGIETYSPMLSSIQKHLSTLQNAVNRANINSCEAASSLVGGIWNKTEVAQNHICTSAGSNGGILSDWASAKQGCSSRDMASKVNNKAGDKYDDILTVNKNLTWEIIKKNSYLNGSDAELKELMMSISGTVILREKKSDKDTFYPYTYQPSISTNRQFLQALLYGGEVEIYKCDEQERCLNPKQVKTKIPDEKSFVNMVSTLLYGIREAIKTDQQLSTEQISFLRTTTIPIYKMFNVEYAWGDNANLLNIDSYAGLIAVELLYQYLSESMELMLQASYSKDFQADFMDNLRSSMRKTLDNLNQERIASNDTIHKSIELIRKSQELEQALAGRLSSHLVNVQQFEAGS